MSVELIPPDAQYEHKPIVLLAYPQLLGSFAMPCMQVLLDKALAGRAQLVKSARICVCAPLLGFEQRAPSAATYASLSAN